MKLLIASGEQSLRRFVQDLVRHLDLPVEIHLASDRLATLAVIADLAPDALLLDDVAPGSWGARACETLNGDPARRSLRIIAPAEDGAAQMVDFPLSKDRFTRDLLRALRSIATATQAEPDRYTPLFEGANDVVYTHDLDGNLTSINPAAERLAGYSAEELLGSNIARFIAPEYLQVARAAMNAKIEGSGPTKYEIELIAKDGRRIPVEISSRMIRRDGAPVEVQGIARDLTAHRRAEEAEERVRRYAASLREAQKRERALRRERRRLVRRLRDIVSRGRLAVAFQPIVELSSGRIVGLEALSRFDHQPLRPPDEWFREAASVGIGPEIELAAVRTALLVAATLPPEQFISLNCSPEAVLADEFAEAIAAVEPSRVVVEITEHAMVRDYAALSVKLERVREKGLRLAIDDLGSGYASLRHILQLYPEIIKLDATLTRTVDADPVRRSLASSLISFAGGMHADVIAEGIESEEQLRALRELGVRYGQGYLLGRPERISPPDARAAGVPGGPGGIARPA